MGSLPRSTRAETCSPPPSPEPKPATTSCPTASIWFDEAAASGLRGHVRVSAWDKRHPGDPVLRVEPSCTRDPRMSESGTLRLIDDVSSSVAIRGKTDITRGLLQAKCLLAGPVAD